ncbi:MAG: DoxX family protein [Mycobacterium sp.]|uniref:DoxX family protein n=1 Tax=Mycobacterium sp. TaxID=1785 RepID=UPI001ED35143|nr:DoxX family protein [Mycobacterium sp.]MBW0017479.1 DoxX family protein [Mycobacterium sp.]
MTKNIELSLARYSPAVLSLFRLVYGLLFAGYGSISLFGWPIASAHPVKVGAWPGWYAGVIELVAGLLIGAGLFTRAAAFVASGEMAVAYFWVHQPRALWPIGDPPGGNGGTPAILFCFGFFLLVFVGAGSYSIDAVRQTKKARGPGRPVGGVPILRIHRR